MTNTQRMIIFEMRRAGVGYKQIANTLNLSRATVRSFCKRNLLLGNGELTAGSNAYLQTDGINCRYCGRKLKQPKTGRHKIFCSDRCRWAWWGQRSSAQRKRGENHGDTGNQAESHGNKIVGGESRQTKIE